MIYSIETHKSDKQDMTQCNYTNTIKANVVNCSGKLQCNLVKEIALGNEVYFL